jgi:two-component system response regulator GlrR
MISAWLEEKGYEVKAEESGNNAVTSLPTFKPDLVITDLRMEDMDGIALLNEIQKYNSILPVIMLSGTAHISDAVCATHQGVFEFLTKPVEPDKLFRSVKSALSLIRTSEIDK